MGFVFVIFRSNYFREEFVFNQSYKHWKILFLLFSLKTNKQKTVLKHGCWFMSYISLFHFHDYNSYLRFFQVSFIQWGPATINKLGRVQNINCVKFTENTSTEIGWTDQLYELKKNQVYIKKSLVHIKISFWSLLVYKWIFFWAPVKKQGGSTGRFANATLVRLSEFLSAGYKKGVRPVKDWRTSTIVAIDLMVYSILNVVRFWALFISTDVLTLSPHGYII